MYEAPSSFLLVNSTNLQDHTEPEIEISREIPQYVYIFLINNTMVNVTGKWRKKNSHQKSYNNISATISVNLLDRQVQDLGTRTSHVASHL